jgi:tRNA A-37 threonylcarbamoyl transferase component Bud32
MPTNDNKGSLYKALGYEPGSMLETNHELLIPLRSNFFLKSHKWSSSRIEALVNVLIIGTVMGFGFLTYHYLDSADLSSQYGNAIFVLILIFLPLFIVTAAQLASVATSHLEVGADGLRIHWLIRQGTLSSRWLPWKAISEISGSHTNEENLLKTPAAIEIHIFLNCLPWGERLRLFLISPIWFWHSRSFTNYRLALMRKAFSGEQDVVDFIAACRAFLPPEMIAPELLQINSEDQDMSFTRLWLDQLQSSRAISFQPGCLEPGATVFDGKYKVIERIATGGQAVTYKAEDRDHNLLVLKEFHIPIRAGKEVKRRSLANVEHEAKLLKKIDHPQIVKLLDFFVNSDRAFLGLQHIDGQSLRKLVQLDGQLPENKVIELARQMADILVYLHGQQPPIVHRDFTPDNLLLRKDGTLVLVDFNVAEQRESAAVSNCVGKHCYVPPEQFAGEATPQSDIYALGATLYYLLVGEDPEPISASHPAKANPNVSAFVDNLVAKSTAPNLSERFQSSSELARQIAQFSSYPQQ